MNNQNSRQKQDPLTALLRDSRVDAPKQSGHRKELLKKLREQRLQKIHEAEAVAIAPHAAGWLSLAACMALAIALNHAANSAGMRAEDPVAKEMRQMLAQAPALPEGAEKYAPKPVEWTDEQRQAYMRMRAAIARNSY